MVRARDLFGVEREVEMEQLRVHTGGDGLLCATYRGALVPLTPLELRVLHELVRANGKPVLREILLASCWQGSSDYDDHARLEAAACRLRKKLVAMTHFTVQMDRGVGYRLAARSDSQIRARLLVLASDASIRRALVRSASEHEVHAAPNVEDAVELLESMSFDAAVVCVPRGTALRDLAFDGMRVLVLGDDRKNLARVRALGGEPSWARIGDGDKIARFLAHVKPAVRQATQRM